MKKILLVFLMLFVFTNFIGVSAVEVGDDLPVEEPIVEDEIPFIVLTDEQELLLDEAMIQLETIKGIVITLITSFIGTGIMGMIAVTAMKKLTKKMTDKVRVAEEENVISKELAGITITAMQMTQDKLLSKVDSMEENFITFIEATKNTDKSVNELITDFKNRDLAIQNLVKEELE